ncbi:MAG: Rossmann-like domain-containing protein [Chloroflexota bacterium]
MILDDLISGLNADAPVRQVIVGAFWTAVVSRYCGLASTTIAPEYQHGQLQVADAGRLAEKSARELASLAKSASLLEATIGLAAINSLIEVDEGQCAELNAGDFLKERGRGKRVAVVGHFPFVLQLRQTAAELWVLELRPKQGDLPADQADVVLPQADIVAITGTAFINHTIDDLLRLCRPDSLVMVLGPTTPLSPVLFDHGIDIISGTRVVDVDQALRYVSEGATFRQIRGTRLLTMRRDGI